MTSPAERAGDPGPEHDTVEVLIAFTRALRAAGVPVTTDRTQSFLRAAALVGADDPTQCYWAGRVTLCGCVDDLERYAQVFAAWFGDAAAHVAAPLASPALTRAARAPLAREEGEAIGDDEDGPLDHGEASAVELLRRRDIAELSAEDRALMAALFARLHLRPPLRTSARRRPTARGEVDVRRTLRSELRNAGEPARLRYRDRSVRSRRIVLLIDVSGSMAAYADSLLRLAHVVVSANRGRTEVFTLGTRLTRVTRALNLRDPEAALAAVGATVPDWSGGTRLGETLRGFLDRWGQRGVARGAVVVVMSDGWETGAAEQLGEQMARLHRLAHGVIWSSPHQGKPGYAPVQSGIVAALPAIDDFVAGHSVATFEDVLAVVAHA